MRTIPQAFNEWMRLYIEEPERFAREFQSVEGFNVALAAGGEPTYGDRCARLLDLLVNEQHVFGFPPTPAPCPSAASS